MNYEKKTVILLFLVVLFDLLFYKQIPGINVFIYSLTLLSICLIQKPELRYDKKWMLIAVISILSSIFVGIYGDILSVLSFLISISLLASYNAKKESSLWIAITGITFTYISSPYILIKKSHLQLIKWKNTSSDQNIIKMGIIGFSFVIVLVFFFIYRNSNILFYNLTQKINLDFITFSLILFTLNGLLLIIAFQKYSPIEKLQNILDKPSKNLENKLMNADEEIKKTSMEQFASIMLLSSLNLLLIIVNILDLSYIINKKLPQGISYSEFIHQGVGMLIISIILAISIILYFFRGQLSFSNNKYLKIFAYTWVIQNLFMIFSSFSRNSMYINACGLTEKRIGVYFYLLLAAIGLITTIIKIYKKQTNAYLIRSTSIAFFTILLSSCIINWDNLITQHDLSRSDASINFNYLNSLSYSNIPQLIDYVEKYKKNNDSINFQNNMEILHKRIVSYLNYYNKNSKWQSISYMRRKTYNEIINKNIHRLYLQDINNQDLDAITYLPFIEEIIVRNSSLDNSNIWSKLRNTKRLSLINCNISSLEFIIYLTKLEYLDITGNDLKNIVPLYTLKNLKELHISEINTEELKMLQNMLQQTKIYY